MTDKIENKIIIDTSTINKITNILSEYWDSLCKKYKVSVPFNMIKTSTYINEVLDGVKHGVSTEDVIDNMLSILRDSGQLMYTRAIFYSDENTSKPVVDHTGVYMLLERYTCVIADAGNDICGLIKYLKNSMLHEMGHILVNYDLCDVGDWDKLNKLLGTLAKNHDECKERLKDPNLSHEEKTKIYYNEILEEKMANAIVGLNYNDLLFITNSTVKEQKCDNKLSIE